MKLSEWIINSTKDSDGNISAMRIMNVLGVGLILYVWAFVSLLKLELVAVPESVGLMFAALLAGKVGSHYLENKSSSTSNETPKLPS
jgi:uncharacterized membrane protein